MLSHNFYKIYKLKKYFKKIKFLFIVNFINKNSKVVSLFQKTFNVLNLKLYKIKNKISQKKLINSKTYLVIKFLMYNFFCFLSLKKRDKFIKKTQLTNIFRSFNITFIGFKLNNKIYAFKKLKKLYNFNYFQNKKVLIKTCVISLKKLNLIHKAKSK